MAESTSTYWTGKLTLYEYLSGVSPEPSNWYAALSSSTNNFFANLFSQIPPSSTYLPPRLVTLSTVLSSSISTLLQTLTTPSKSGLYGFTATLPSLKLSPTGIWTPSNIKFNLQSDNIFVAVIIMVCSLHYIVLVLRRVKKESVKEETPVLEREYSRSRSNSSTASQINPPFPHNDDLQISSPSPTASTSDPQTLPPTPTTSQPPPANKYYCIQTQPSYDTTNLQLLKTHRPSHLTWLSTLESSGLLFTGGDITTEGESLYIIRAEGFEEAEGIAMGDPWCRECCTTFKVFQYEVRWGRVGVSVKVGGGEYRLE